jgi:serine/threonine-protein kinase
MDETPRLPEQIPQTIGRYQVLASVGYGAMGAVYKAFDPLIKRTLAIKTIRLDIPRQSPQYKSFIERFYHEARISGTLSHPNIVTLFDIGEEGGVPYLAMEFVEGETLSSILERGVRFPPEKVIGLISQIASAVDYAHSKGVIHRDIKPSNLILYEAERVKVTDFGIAKLVDAEITHSGTLLGTPSYMSPEQAMGDKLDGRSDIFSLGVCAFEMLSGEQPFPGTNVTSILYKLVHVDPIEPANLEMNGLVPQKWHEVFGRVLAKRPDDRYQTATDFVQDLEYCLGAWFGGIADDLLGDAGSAEATADTVVSANPMAAVVGSATMPIAAPARHSDDSTASFPIMPPPVPSLPPAAPATTPRDAGPTATLPPGAPEPEPVPATVALSSPARATGATVVMGGGPARGSTDVTLKSVPAPLATRPAAPALTEKVPLVPLPVPPPPAADEVTRKEAVPAAAIPASARRAPRLSARMILAIAGLLTVAAVGLGMVALYRRLATPRAVAIVPPPSTQAAVPPPTPAPTATAAAPAANGTLHVRSDPPGAAVSVDGEPRGVTPVDVAGLSLGSHPVKVELKGYEPRSENVTLAAGAPRAELSLRLQRAAPATGLADILSEPAGALVSVDGSAVGYTPLMSWRMKPGSRDVRMAKDGHEPWSGTLAVKPGKRARLDVELKAVKAAPPPPRADAVDPAKVYEVGDVDARPSKVSGEWAQAPKLKSGERISVAGTFVVSERGEVIDLRITESGGKAVDEAVAAALRKWRYAPATKRGVKVKVRLPFRQTFTTG